MSDRITSRDGGKTSESHATPDFSKFNVHDSYSNSLTNDSTGEAGEEHRRISRLQLEELDRTLGERDGKILVSIQQYRYLLTSQIQRLHFTDATTPTAALRATNRNLKKLRELGLVDHLARRIGGVRAGSGSLIWRLTHAGERLIFLRNHTLTPTKRFFEPSPFFLAHTLAVADISISLTELSHSHPDVKLTILQTEPECWRTYSEHGNILALKPDLFAVTVSGQYEDRWFIEVDLDTESPSKIINKCERYHRYYRTGLEQQEAEVFPLTVWIVPTEGRKNKLIAHIKKAYEKQPKLFAVITKDELETLIRRGGNGGMLC